MILIYTLQDPDTLEIKYVGITRGSLDSRLQHHVRSSRNIKTINRPVMAWIASLSSLPIIKEIDRTEESFVYAEQYLEPMWIWLLISWGVKLLNRHHVITNYKNVPQHLKSFRKIHQYSLKGDYIKTFNSGAEASLELDKDSSKIFAAINGTEGRVKAYGFQWKTGEVESKIDSVTEKVPNAPIKVVQKDLKGNIIKVWKSGQEASIKLNIHKSKICMCCKGKRKSHKGFLWEYEMKI